MHQDNGPLRANTPPPSRNYARIVRVGQGATNIVTSCSPNLWGVWTHWDGQRSLPCFGKDRGCDPCRRGLPKRWKGFILCRQAPRDPPCFVELTPLAAQSIQDQLPSGETLRGYTIRLERGKHAKTARLTATLLGRNPAALEALPPDQDPMPTLQHIWGLDTIDEGPVPSLS